MRKVTVPIDMASEQKTILGIMSKRHLIYLFVGGAILYAIIPFVFQIFPNYIVGGILSVITAIPIISAVVVLAFLKKQKLHLHYDHYLLIKMKYKNQIGIWRKGNKPVGHYRTRRLKNNSEEHGVIKQSFGTKTFFRPFYIPRDGYPRKMATNWLYNLTSSGVLDLYVDVHKVGKSDSVRTLQRQITMLESNLAFQKRRGNIDQLMLRIQFSENDMYMVCTLGMFYAQSEKELNRYSEALEDEMSSMFFSIVSR